MSEFTVMGGKDGYVVWIQLEKGDPTEQGESFIIGHGLTRIGALSAAIGQLQADMDTLIRLREDDKLVRLGGAAR
jgi:hypothetical protein